MHAVGVPVLPAVFCDLPARKEQEKAWKGKDLLQGRERGFGSKYPPNWKPSPPIKDIYIRGGSKVQKQLMHRRRGGGLNSWQSAAGGARTRVASTQRRT